MKYIKYIDSEKSENYLIEEIPLSMKQEAEDKRNQMIEAIAENSDLILEKYFGNEQIEVSELYEAIRESVIQSKFLPVTCGSSFKNKGVQELLNSIVRYLPSPIDR